MQVRFDEVFLVGRDSDGTILLTTCVRREKGVLIFQAATVRPHQTASPLRPVGLLNSLLVTSALSPLSISPLPTSFTANFALS